MRRPASLAVLIAADAWVLTACRPRWSRLLGAAAHPSGASDSTDATVQRFASAALWLLALWLAAGLLAALLSGTPGALGHLADRMARIMLPRALYRVAAGAAGLGMLLAPAASAAAAPAPSAVSAAPATPGTPTPTWPTSPPTSPPGSSSPPVATLPAPTWPSSSGRSPGPDASGHTRSVRVHRGDSLWLIAAQRLGPGSSPQQITAEWHRWYALNRATIGADPNLLLPGESLRVPGSGAHS